jgi:hypothetical protein
MKHDPRFKARCEDEAAGHNYHGGEHEDHTTNICIDAEFII